MPVEFLILPDLDVSYIRFTGHVAINQIDFAFNTYLEDEHYQPGRREFIDLSQVKRLDMSIGGVEAHFKRMLSEHVSVGSAPVTAIYAPDIAIADFAHAYAMMTKTTDAVDVTVYDDPDDVLAALGIRMSAKEFFRTVAGNRTATR